MFEPLLLCFPVFGCVDLRLELMLVGGLVLFATVELLFRDLFEEVARTHVDKLVAGWAFGVWPLVQGLWSLGVSYATVFLAHFGEWGVLSDHFAIKGPDWSTAAGLLPELVVRI